MKTSYFTFGQVHTHSFNGKTLDKDIVLRITAEDPRAVMVKYFVQKWAMEYDEPPRMDLFPRGIYDLIP